MSKPCSSGKVSYSTRGKASAAVRIIRNRGQRREGGKKPSYAYLCRECRSWHLTSAPH